MPIYEIFDLIAQSGVGNVGGAGLVLLQLYISMFFEIKFLFSSMKNRPIYVKALVSLIPLIFIATYSIVCGIIFSAFLDKGPSLSEMTRLINITLQKNSISEMMIAVAVFCVLMIIYSIVYKMKPLEWLLTFGIETSAALSLLVLYGGLYINNFPFTIFELCEIDIYFARWPIYGYFTIMFKCFVLAISLLLGLLVRERKAKSENEEEQYTNRFAYYESKTLKFLTKNYLISGISLIIFDICAVGIFVYAFSRDTSSTEFADVFFVIIMLTALCSFILVMGIYLVYNALRPQTMKSYRKLISHGNSEKVLRLFCEEIVDGSPSEYKQQFNDTELRTEHFALRRKGARIIVEWIDDI